MGSKAQEKLLMHVISQQLVSPKEPPAKTRCVQLVLNLFYRSLSLRKLQKDLNLGIIDQSAALIQLPSQSKLEDQFLVGNFSQITSLILLSNLIQAFKTFFASYTWYGLKQVGQTYAI